LFYFRRAEPPSAPQNLTVNFVDQSTVTLSWNPPNFLGGRADVAYRLMCDMCGPSVVFMPNNVSPSSPTIPARIKTTRRRSPQEVFNDTKITVSGLSAATTYRFHVWAENGVTNMTSSESRQFVDIAVTTTETSVRSASVNNVRVMLVKASEIALSWDPPMAGFADADAGGGGGDDDDRAVEVYEVSGSVRVECRDATFCPRALTVFRRAGQVLSAGRRVERQQQADRGPARGVRRAQAEDGLRVSGAGQDGPRMGRVQPDRFQDDGTAAGRRQRQEHATAGATEKRRRQRRHG